MSSLFVSAEGTIMSDKSVAGLAKAGAQVAF